jgi:hypothetical protein
MIIKIRGVTYPSVRAAAEAQNVQPNAIYSALNRGNVDMIGMGRNVKKPITLGGISFPSLGVASVALGFGRTYLGRILNYGTDVTRKKVADAVAAYKEKMK